MTADEYRAAPGINFSTLKYMALSPLHFDHVRRHGTEDSIGRLKGRATHAAVLEPERFVSDYVVFPGERRQGNAWKAFAAEHGEDRILKADEMNHCQDVAAVVHAHDDARGLIVNSAHERVIEWFDEVTGLPCKGRLDMLGAGFIADLKGVRSVDLRVLAHEVARMQYHAQLAFYAEGARRVTGRDYEALLICVEHNPPHDVVVVQLTEDDLYAGATINRLHLDRVAACMATGKWPGRHQGRQLLQLPPWVFPDGDQPFEAEVIE